MAGNIGVIANIGVVKVGDLLLVSVQPLVERPIAIDPSGVFGIDGGVHRQCERLNGKLSGSRSKYLRSR